MPVLAKFYGIIIRMICAQSLGARFHAFYENHELVVNIWPLQVVGGDAPDWVKAKVLEWASRHQGELMEAWHSCKMHCPPQPIWS